MRHALRSGACASVVLAVCTSPLATAVLAQTGSEQRPKMTVTGGRRLGEHAERKRGNPAPPVAEFHLRSMDVASKPNGVSVSMAVDIFDTRANVTYLWKLRVTALDPKKVIWERLYDNQMFKFANGANAHPTFAETVQLPAGDYRAEVTLYEIPDGFRLEALKDKATSKGQTVLRGVRKMAVGAG
jgi:hypothetical protein